MITDLINYHTNKNFSIMDIKNKLIELWNRENDKGNKTHLILYKILNEVNKSLGKLFFTGESIDLVILNEEYFISELDMYLLFSEFNMNVVVLTNKGATIVKYYQNEMLICNKNNFSTISNDNPFIYNW